MLIVILSYFERYSKTDEFFAKQLRNKIPAFEPLTDRHKENDKMGQVSLPHESVNSYLISQYPVHCASRAFFPNLRSHSSAIWACVGVQRLDDTWIVVPLGIPARLSFSVHVKTFAIDSILL